MDRLTLQHSTAASLVFQQVCFLLDSRPLPPRSHLAVKSVSILLPHFDPASELHCCLMVVPMSHRSSGFANRTRRPQSSDLSSSCFSTSTSWPNWEGSSISSSASWPAVCDLVPSLSHCSMIASPAVALGCFRSPPWCGWIPSIAHSCWENGFLGYRLDLQSSLVGNCLLVPLRHRLHLTS